MARVTLSGKASKVFKFVNFLYNLYGSITLEELERRIG